MERKKKLWVIPWIVCFILSATACQGGNTDAALEQTVSERGAREEIRKEDGKKVRKDEKEESQKGEEDGGDKNHFPGTYTVPDGWLKAEQYSTAEVSFYVEEGHENDNPPDNISIHVGTNRYPAEDHESFREAILGQLMAQIGKQEDTALYGDGTYTEQGYPLYIFTIEEEAEGIMTKQYYIIDDYRFCLIHLTNFTGSEMADKAARAMADSFVWETEEE